MIKEVAYQIDAVNELVKKTIGLLNEQSDRKKLVFKAPTGSGKTVMASQMLDELTTQLAEEGKEVALIWIAPNKLHQQSYLKMKNFFTETRVLHPVMYDELDHSINGYIKPGEVFFVNWESINKDKNLMARDTENSASLYDITRRTQEEHELPIIVVIDEEHMFGGRAAKQSEKVLKNINPKVEIRISATPITQPDELVTVSRDKVIKEEMIKDGITINPMVNDPNSGMSENEYLLEQALAKRQEIKAAYEALGIRINPLLLIQLPNDNSEMLDENERSIIEMVKARLDAKYGITTNNCKLAVWLASEKQNLDGLENDYNMTEVLLFKQAIALGWDCPRAAVLLIFRDIQSTTFGVQTVGRIMRMPEQKYYPNQLLNHGWVFTNLSRDRIEIVAEDMSYITKALVAYRRKNLTNVSLASVYSERLSAERNRLGPDFWPILVETFNNKWFKQPIQGSLFDFSPFEDEENSGEKKAENDTYDSGFLKDIAKNRKLAEKIAGIDFTNHGVQVQLLSDVEVTGEAGTTLIDENKIVKFARNQEELIIMLTKFCEKLIAGFEKISVTSLRGYIYEFMQDYLGFFETESPRVILYYRNRPKFEEVIRRAIEKYLEKIAKRRREAKQRAFKEYKWEVPEAREYNETANKVVDEMKNHALLPFIQLKNVSKPEDRFEKFLESYEDSIDWWYKNGDEGKQHYSIPYTASDDTQSLFYIDFIIRMKNGQIFLFDTKSPSSDFEAANKHNALVDYITDERNAGLNLKGGVLIEQGGNWYYCPMKIENTNDLVGWDAFHPDLYK
jgi:DNA or RNA helicases of superfamily II